MRRRTGPIVLAAWVLVAAGCGAHPDVAARSTGDAGAVAAGRDTAAVGAGDPSTATIPAATPDAVDTTPGPATARGGQASAPDAAGEPPAADGSDAPDPGGAGRDDTERAVPIDLAVTPTCVAVGETVAAHISTVPDAELTLAVGYADGQPHGQMGFARADGDGSHVWRWVVAPDVPPGEATVLAMSVTPEGDAADTERAPFTVASSGGCP